jgi:hypothetical protein
MTASRSQSGNIMDTAIIEAADRAARHSRFAGDGRPGDSR